MSKKLNSEGFEEWVDGTEEEFPVPQDIDFGSGMIYIVGGNVGEAKSFVRKHGIYPPKWHYVSTERDLMGATGKVIYVGHFYQRADISEINNIVQLGVDGGHLEVLDIDE